MSSTDSTWDYYLTLLDERPASIRVDLRWMTEPPPAANVWLYVSFLPIPEPGDDGLGGAPDRDALQPVEDAVFERVRAVSGTPVARVRNKGRWQLVAYGPEGMDWEAWHTELAPEGTDVAVQPDPNCAYLQGVLLPNPERQLWMYSRRTVDELAHHGDLLHLPREVAHRVVFPDGQVPRAFMEAILAKDFDPSAHDQGVDFKRFDMVDLDQIHETVMMLVQLADDHGGEYRGWQCDLEVDGAA